MGNLISVWYPCNSDATRTPQLVETAGRTAPFDNIVCAVEYIGG
jgi:hypothetical protein